MPTPVNGVSLPFLYRLSFSSRHLGPSRGLSLQRLFSMFPNGWPGRGLLLLRCIAASLLIYDGVTALLDTPPLGVIVFHVAAVGAGLMLIAGLWTPLAGLLVVIVQSAFAFYATTHIRSAILLATLGAALVMLGPGVNSIDARLFGRKRIDIH